MARSPRILVSPSLERRGAEFDDESSSLSDCYALAIHNAGGIPLILPRIPSKSLVEEAMTEADGLVLTGGDDIQSALHRPRLSPELRRKAGEADAKRDAMELLLVDAAFSLRKPLLAICRGHQLLNVALGGTLLVDIESERPRALRHNCSGQKDGFAHEILIEPGSLMAEIAGATTLQVNSCHHQAVKRLSPGLKATAVSADGIIEVIELGDELRAAHPFVLSVQFHPERLTNVDPAFARVFQAFISACAGAPKK
jgi:putative glutamine amidotransferase